MEQKGKGVPTTTTTTSEAKTKSQNSSRTKTIFERYQIHEKKYGKALANKSAEDSTTYSSSRSVMYQSSSSSKGAQKGGALQTKEVKEFEIIRPQRQSGKQTGVGKTSKSSLKKEKGGKNNKVKNEEVPPDASLQSDIN